MLQSGRWALLEEINDERDRQDRLKAQGKFARTCADEMSNLERLSVLAEEFGEAAHEVNETIGGHRALDVNRLRAELRQVAAVCLGWIEGLQNDELRERQAWERAQRDTV